MEDRIIRFGVLAFIISEYSMVLRADRGPLMLVDKLVPKWHHVDVANPIETSRKRITARVPESVHEILERAANLLGATVNQFVLQTALHEAQRVIDRETAIHLTPKDTEMILSLLDNPPKPERRLQQAVKLFRKSVRA